MQPYVHRSPMQHSSRLSAGTAPPGFLPHSSYPPPHKQAPEPELDCDLESLLSTMAEDNSPATLPLNETAASHAALQSSHGYYPASAWPPATAAPAAQYPAPHWRSGNAIPYAEHSAPSWRSGNDASQAQQVQPLVFKDVVMPLVADPIWVLPQESFKPDDPNRHLHHFAMTKDWTTILCIRGIVYRSCK